MSATTPTDSPARGGDALFALMTVAVLIASAGIAGLGVLGSWWLLPLVMVGLIALAIAVAGSLVRLMRDDDAPAVKLEA